MSPTTKFPTYGHFCFYNLIMWLPYLGVITMKNYFEGLYFKNNIDDKTIAFIPAIHADSNGKKAASIQVVTNDFTQMIAYPAKDFRADRNYTVIAIGNSVFSRRGLKLDINEKDLKINGSLFYGKLTPPCYDIMGPFAHVPFLQCRHSLISLRHSVAGQLSINGSETTFQNGVGYIEGDRGSSFPKRYIWTQCNFGNNSLMLSVADIPFLCMQFTGIISSVFLDGKEYRMASYCGAHVVSLDNNSITIKQGDLQLTAELLEDNGHKLHAPVMGEMTRFIHENLSCRVRYLFKKGNDVLFDFESDKAGFEHEWY